MEQYMPLSKIKDNAKDRLQGQYRNLIWGCFFFFLIIAGVFLAFAFPILMSVSISMVTGNLTYYPFYTGFLQTGLVLSQILAGFLRIGAAYACFQIICGQSCYYGSLFYGFSREAFLKTLFLTLMNLLVRLLFQIPFFLLLTRITNTADDRLLIAALLVAVAGYVCYIPVGLTFDIAYFLLPDFPEKKAGDLLQDSFSLLRGQRRRFFLLKLGFLPLYFLCILSFGAGLLWIIPFTQMAQVLFYLDLMKS
ncbi:MAG: DUF975 family protein [Roseburia sp.]|nr:DUF975 family protein [Roseburia sp.]MCM1099450.1 DUF975 family protein [Ruminococcus flavefaciens]